MYVKKTESDYIRHWYEKRKTYDQTIARLKDEASQEGDYHGSCAYCHCGFVGPYSQEVINAFADYVIIKIRTTGTRKYSFATKVLRSDRSLGIIKRAVEDACHTEAYRCPNALTSELVDYIAKDIVGHFLHAYYVVSKKRPDWVDWNREHLMSFEKKREELENGDSVQPMYTIAYRSAERYIIWAVKNHEGDPIPPECEFY